MLEIQWNEFKFSKIEYHQNMVKLLSLVRMPRMGGPDKYVHEARERWRDSYLNGEAGIS